MDQQLFTPAAVAPARPARTGVVLALLAGLALLPFALVALPAMIDLPGHIARFHVMGRIAESPALQGFYAFEWRLVGNLGIDLIVRALMPWVGAEAAARLAIALIAPLTILGIAAASRALFGRIQPSAVAASCLVFSNPLMSGFLNYSLSIALALLVYAGWIVAERRPARWWWLLAPAVTLVWVAHAMGWVILALLVAGAELARLRASRGASLPGACLRALAFLPPVLLTLAWPSSGEGSSILYGSDLMVRKIMNWVVVLRGTTKVADLGTVLALGAAVGFCAWRGWLRLDLRAGLGAALLALACLLMPTTVFGSWGADERLAPVAVLVFLLGLRWDGPRRAATLFVAACAALFVLRTGVITYRWIGQDAAYASHLRALEAVPQGARIHAIVLQDRCRGAWGSTADHHLPSLAVARRDALVNSLWFLPGSALLTVRYPTDPRFKYESQGVAGFGCAGFDPAPLQARLAALRPGDWDYVWILRTHGRPEPWPGHAPLFQDGDSVLYRAP